MPRKRDAVLVVDGIYGIGNLDGDDLAIARGSDVVLCSRYQLINRADAWAQ